MTVKQVRNDDGDRITYEWCATVVHRSGKTASVTRPVKKDAMKEAIDCLQIIIDAHSEQ